ncbi:1115_t:CDS:1, partial [Ambispora gerdemannii]
MLKVRFWNRKVWELDELNCSTKSFPDLVQGPSSELRSLTGSSKCGPVLRDARGFAVGRGMNRF